MFAKAAYHGYDMIKKYSQLKDLPFKEDGVLEVSLNKKSTKILEKYLRWGKQN